MNHKKIKMVLLGFIIMFSISATPTMWPCWAALTQNAKQYSIMFKNLKAATGFLSIAIYNIYLMQQPLMAILKMI
jgi:hypothetical protein